MRQVAEAVSRPRTRRRAAAAVVAAAVVLAARRAGQRPVQPGTAGRLVSPSAARRLVSPGAAGRLTEVLLLFFPALDVNRAEPSALEHVTYILSAVLLKLPSVLLTPPTS